MRDVAAVAVRGGGGVASVAAYDAHTPTAVNDPLALT
jgi:hypothetical protein